MNTDEIARFLADLGLAEYLPAFEENAIDVETLPELTDGDLREIGITKLGHRKKLLAAIASLAGESENLTPGSGAASSPAPEWLATVPGPVAVPLAEYAEESHPVAKLWSACDAVEMLVRLLVIGQVAAASDAEGELDEKLRNQLAGVIDAPTLGAWFVMAEALAKSLVKTSQQNDSVSAPVRASAEFTTGPLRDLLYGPDKPGTAETSFLRLRNRLAHGGGLLRAEANRLLGLWREAFESTMEEAATFLGQWNLLGRDESDTWRRIAGAGEAPAWEGENPAPEEERDAVWLVAGEGATPLPLWPLTLYGRPCSLDGERERHGTKEAAQVYTRKESVRLAYTPVGAEGMAQSESGPSAMARFEAWFRADRPKGKKNFEVADFLREIRKDAADMVGRQEELDCLLGEIRSREQGVLWVAGAAGMGKSFLMAKAVSELLDHDAGEHDEGTRVLVLPYRMRAGDGSRCRREALAQFVVERLEAEEALKDFFEDKEKAKGEERLENALGALRDDVRVILPVDGLDEVMRRDESFAGEVPLGVRLPRVLWVCAGRPEPAIEDAMRRLGGETVFPEGLPPMRSSDILGMILEKIGPLRRRLLAGDEEKDGEVINPFIERVTERAAGLPLYVKYVIGDVLGGRYRVLDGAEDLPDSLHAYHEELLRRLGVGDLQAVVTPLAATLACAHEPLSLRELVAVLAWRKLIAEEGGAELLERGLAAIESMIRTAPDPEGEVGYTLFHQSLRTHILGSDQMTHAVATTREAMADLSEEKEVPEVVRNYFLRCGVRHLLEADRREAAKERLLELTVKYDFDLLVNYADIYRWWHELGGEVTGGPLYVAATDELLNKQEVDECEIDQVSLLSSLLGFLGWIETSEKICEIALRVVSSIPECETWELQRALSELAHTQLESGNLEKAEANARRSLALAEAEFGTSSPATMEVVNLLGMVVHEKGDLAEAELLYRRAILGRQADPDRGPEHSDTLVCQANLGSCLCAQGDLEGAETILRSVLASEEKVYGPVDLATLTTAGNVGYLAVQKGDYEEAEVLYRRVLEGRERALGLEHQDTLNSIYGLADLLILTGSLEEAQDLFRRYHKGAEKNLGPDALARRNDGRSRLVTLVTGKSNTVEEANEESLNEILDTLTPREKLIFEMRFGLRDGVIADVEWICNLFGISRERIRQIEAKALRKLRHPGRIRQLEGFIENDTSESHTRKSATNRVDESPESGPSLAEIINGVLGESGDSDDSSRNENEKPTGPSLEELLGKNSQESEAHDTPQK